jgi:SAM-dependent methyltransferase
MTAEEKHDLKQGRISDRRFILNPSNKILARIMPWHVGLAIVEPIGRLFEPPQKLVEPYVKSEQIAADLGCGRGYYTLALAELVGPKGKVYAVDLDKKNIQAVQKRAARAGYHNIEAYSASAANLSFIKDKSIDFILANGLL